MPEPAVLTPVPYCDRARKAAPKHGTCPLCGLVKKLLLDHCHPHWLCRGSICYSCNMRMSYLDGGYHTARGYSEEYYEWRYRCPACQETAVRYTWHCPRCACGNPEWRMACKDCATVKGAG